MHIENCRLIKPLSCRKKTSAVEAAKLLRENKQKRLIVINESEYPVGILSTTDISNKVVAENKDSSKLKSEDIMTSPVYLVCDINDDANEIFRKMVHHETFFVPVLKDEKLFGVLTYGELMKCVHNKLKDGNS